MTDQRKSFFLATFLINRILLEDLITKPKGLDIKFKEGKKFRM